MGGREYMTEAEAEVFLDTWAEATADPPLVKPKGLPLRKPKGLPPRREGRPHVG